MSSSSSEEELLLQSTPPEILNEAKIANDSLIPEKSKKKYLAAYDSFMTTYSYVCLLLTSVLKNVGSSSKNTDIDGAVRGHTLSKADRKKGAYTGTMKLMSAHDEKTLDTAVAMANEITTRSMNDLCTDHKLASSPNERTKFHFKFPLVSLHHNNLCDTDKDTHEKHAERRNFSDEANRVSDIQSTLTEESKLAYASLIEQPTPSSSLISQMNIHKAVTMQYTPAAISKEVLRTVEARAQFHSLQKHSKAGLSSKHGTVDNNSDDLKNELPLPPRTTKPKLVDKPRHIRKYPLRMPNNNMNQTPINDTPMTAQPIIYQNTFTCPIITVTDHSDTEEQKEGIKLPTGRVDSTGGAEPLKIDTNPFTSFSEVNSANPFHCYLETVKGDDGEEIIQGEQYFEEGSLVKDHVSVEDLLEFADQKPCGRQRGVESDEVRIMRKVLKQQVSPEGCLEALELSDWNVHHAIKVMRVKISVDSDVTLDNCHRELLNSGGDVLKASSILLMCKQSSE